MNFMKYLLISIFIKITKQEFTSSKSSLRHRTSNMVRPMSRKDIFYSGSVTNLKEYQSQRSLQDYRQSVVSLTNFEREHRDDPKTNQDVENPPDICPCLNLPPAFKNALSSMLDVTLLKDPAFMLIGISNLFGMAALYIPFFFLVDASQINVRFFVINSFKFKFSISTFIN